MIYKTGDRILLPTIDVLTHNGWKIKTQMSHDYLWHDNHRSYVINDDMMPHLGTEVVLISTDDDEFYEIEGDRMNWVWHSSILDLGIAQNMLISREPKDHKCVEGSTTIGNFYICKICGTNLRTIK